MKKVLAIAFLAATMVACNNTSDKKAEGGDSTKVDSPAVKVDSPAVKVDSPAMKVDSPAVKADSAK